MPLTQLTPEQVEDECQIEKRRIAFLDAKLASFSPPQRLELKQWLAKYAAESINFLTGVLIESGAIKAQDQTVKISLIILSSAGMRHHFGRVIAGVAWIDTATIGLLDHLALAPEEVVRSVMIHECLHLLYPHANQNLFGPLTIRADIVNQYPTDQHCEEEWVRRMEARICGLNHSLDYWEMAVEEFGDNWKPVYEKLIKQQAQALGKHCGQSNSMTVEQRAEIVRLVHSGQKSQTEVARLFSADPATVCRIVHHNTETTTTSKTP